MSAKKEGRGLPAAAPIETMLQALYRSTGHEASKCGNGWQSRCPSHDDSNPSLSINAGDDGKVLLKCHAGCKSEDVVRAVGLTIADLFPPKPKAAARKPRKSCGPRASNSGGPGANKAPQKIVATYDYKDESGAILFQVVRYEPKGFRQRRPDGKGGWTWSVKGVRQVPYRLDAIAAAPGKPVVIVEGEKDADNLARLGSVVTCNAGGAGKWTEEHSQCLAGRVVIILPDNDDTGRSHAESVAASLQGIATTVRVVELPGLPPKGDVSDWLAAGGTRDQLRDLAKATPEWAPANPSQTWPELQSFDQRDLPEFPVDALPPVLGDWVAAESHATQTPADLAGLLGLSVCSAAISRRVIVEPRPGWLEPVNTYTAVLLDPGNRKSAVFADATRPLKEWERELVDLATPIVARAQSERRQSEARMRKLEKKAVDKDDAVARHDACILAEELANEPEPVLPRLIADDATSEKLGMMLAEHGGRITSMSPEGGVFDLMAGLYSKSGIPQFGVYLMGHSGDDLVTDRVSRKSVHVERPALTCAYAMQPQVIEGLASEAAFRGRGLLARFLYSAPKSWIGRREVGAAPVPDAVRDAYHQLVRKLAATEGEFVLQLTADASAALLCWETEIEEMLDEGGQMEVMRDWGAKLAGATIRLAAVLHCVQHGPTGKDRRFDYGFGQGNSRVFGAPR